MNLTEVALCNPAGVLVGERLELRQVVPVQLP
jgi:hypothetical protein